MLFEDSSIDVLDQYIRRVVGTEHLGELDVLRAYPVLHPEVSCVQVAIFFQVHVAYNCLSRRWQRTRPQG